MRRFARYELHPVGFTADGLFFPDSRAALRRTIKSGDIEIDTIAMKIVVRGNEIETSNLEFRLLYYLLHNQGRVFSRDQLLSAVWGAEFVELRSVDTCIRRIRRKIEPEPLRPTYLKTVRGAGYCLQPNAA